MAVEYYVIKSVPSRVSGQEKAWELLKYNSNRQISGVGHVYQDCDGCFTSDDTGFRRHRNELASRRIRVVKKHIELGEPKFACYWMDKGKIGHFQA